MKFLLCKTLGLPEQLVCEELPDPVLGKVIITDDDAAKVSAGETAFHPRPDR